MKVLLVIDMLNDFCPGGALPVKHGNEIVPTINRLMREGDFDLIVAVNDAHPPGHKSFASSHQGHAPFEAIDYKGINQMLWPDHGIPGTWGSEFHRDLDQSKISKIFYKGTNLEIDSYSAFFDNAKLHQTELHAYLLKECQQHGVSPNDMELVFCGLALDYCVKFSALDARELGYKAGVVYDATRAVNLQPYDEMKALHELEAVGVELTTSSRLLGRFISIDHSRVKGVEVQVP